MHKLNLGSGNKPFPGWLNVDKFPVLKPDLVHDLEVTPWPIAADSCDEVLLQHVLEHLGRDLDTHLRIIQELYRVCVADALITISLPHPRHDDFMADPGHVRAILPQSFYLFSREMVRAEQQQENSSLTPYAFLLDVDFDVEGIEYIPDKRWLRDLESRAISQAELFVAMRDYNNVMKEFTIRLRVRKPLR